MSLTLRACQGRLEEWCLILRQALAAIWITPAESTISLVLSIQEALSRLDSKLLKLDSHLLWLTGKLDPVLLIERKRKIGEQRDADVPSFHSDQGPSSDFGVVKQEAETIQDEMDCLWSFRTALLMTQSPDYITLDIAQSLQRTEIAGLGAVPPGSASSLERSVNFYTV